MVARGRAVAMCMAGDLEIGSGYADPSRSPTSPLRAARSGVNVPVVRMSIAVRMPVGVFGCSESECGCVSLFGGNDNPPNTIFSFYFQRMAFGHIFGAGSELFCM